MQATVNICSSMRGVPWGRAQTCATPKTVGSAVTLNIHHPQPALPPAQPVAPRGLPTLPLGLCHRAKLRRDVATLASSASTEGGLADTSTNASSEGTSTWTQALFNSINILLGVGLLSIPFALKVGGWSSIAVLTLLCASTNYTGKILMKCLEAPPELCAGRYALPAPRDDDEDEDAGGKREPSEADGGQWARGPKVAAATMVTESLSLSSMSWDYDDDELESRAASGGAVSCSPRMATYEDIGEAAFGPLGRGFITTVLYTELVGTCALFLILEGDHLQLLWHALAPAAALPTKQALMVGSAAAIIPTTWLPDLSALSVLGSLGMVSAIGLTGMVALDFFGPGAMEMADTAALHVDTLPITFGLLAFVFAGHAVFPSIYTSMRDRKQFGSMLDASYVVVFSVCLLMGALGYAAYGDAAAEEVTLNLPDGVLRLCATALILVSPATKFALTLEPVASGLDRAIGTAEDGDTRARGLPSAASRTALGVGALGLATSVPHFGYVMAVIGAFLTLTVSVIFPAAVHLKMFGPQLRPAERAANWGIIGLGLFCAGVGTWTAVGDLLEEIARTG